MMNLYKHLRKWWVYMNNNIDFEQIKLAVLPYFIQIYGEEYKDIIVDRLNKIEPIFYSDLDSNAHVMHNMQSQKRAELTIKFLEDNGIYLSEELKEKAITTGNTYGIKNNVEAKKLLDICFSRVGYDDYPDLKIKKVKQVPLDNEYLIRTNVEFFEKLGCNVNEQNYNDWILSDEATKIFEKIKDLLLKINKLDAEYHEFDRQFADFKKTLDRGIEIKRSLEEKYMLEFLGTIKQHMNKHDIELLENYLNSSEKDYYSFKRNMSILKIVGDSLYDDSILNAFSSKSDEKLSDPEIPNYMKQSINSDRIKYYKEMNMYNGEIKEEEFLKSNVALFKRMPQNLADEILAKKENYRNLCEEKYVEETSSYKENMEDIQKMGFETESSFNAEIIKNGIKCINPNVRIVNGKPESVALLLFSVQNCPYEYIDVTLIHEINHAIELSLVDYSNDNVICKTGFEYLSECHSKRFYTQFSEIINQIIAMEVTEAMHKDGVYLFDNPKTSKIKGATSYENQIQFVQGFWEHFRKDIMYARINNNMDSLFATIGRENFEELNNIINENVLLPRGILMNDLINNRTTELTMKYDALMKRAITVQNKMIEYSNNYEVESLGKAI